jgi:hypothetical protein
MKAKIRKTGEIVDVICYGGSPNKRNYVLDYVNYIDSQGMEHIESNHLNYYWDFESIETATDEQWQDVRERAAIAAMQGFLSRTDYHADLETLAKDSVKLANCLIEELKKV